MLDLPHVEAVRGRLVERQGDEIRTHEALIVAALWRAYDAAAQVDLAIAQLVPRLAHEPYDEHRGMRAEWRRDERLLGEAQQAPGGVGFRNMRLGSKR